MKAVHYLLFTLLFIAIAPLAGEWKPRASVITSVYKGDNFIAGYLQNLVQQTIFHDCEFIIVNANSPGNEDTIISEYAKKYPNIVYIKLPKDPGLYAVWNFAIGKSRAPYITNWNIDDRRSYDSLELQVQALDTHPDINLVYADIYIGNVPNQTFASRDERSRCVVPEFSMRNMKCCFAGPGPMWRKKMHEDCGLFNEWFTSAGDWELWQRAASRGHRFMKMNQANCLYYLNPQGISTTRDAVKAAVRDKEVELIIRSYQHLWV